MATSLPGDGIPVAAPEEQVVRDLPHALQEPTQPTTLWFQVLYGLANATIGIGNITFFTLLLPAKLAQIAPSNQTNTFIVISSLGAAAAILTNPLVGRFSDRTTSSLGRRLPWLMVGMIILALSMLLEAAASSLFVLGIGAVVLQIAVNTLLAALSAIIPDQVPVSQRATVSAFSGMAPLVGGLVGQILVGQVIHDIATSFLDLGLISLVLLLLFSLVLREQRLPHAALAPLRMSDIPRSLWLNPRTYRDFALTWLARCLIFLATTTVINYLFYYLVAERLFSEAHAATGVQFFYTIYVGAIVVCALIGGKLSDWLQRRKIFVIGSSLVIALGLFLLAFFPIWNIVLVGAAIIGVGFGSYLSSDLALASQLLPQVRNRGKDFALMNTAIFVPMLIAPALASIALGIFQSYSVLLVIIAIGTLLAGILILPIRAVR